MSHTTTGNTVRYTPDPKHRARRQPASVVAGALGIAVSVGALGIIGIGMERALPIMGVTVVVTVLGVLLWRWTLPRLVSVTVSESEIVYRNYGRTRRVRRNENTRATARLLVVNFGFQTPYLVISGDGGQFMLNVDVWREQDLVEIAGSDASWTSEPALVDAKALEREFPGLLPSYISHPNRFAIMCVVVAVAVIIGAMAAFAAITADDGGDDEQPAAAIERKQSGELTDEQAGTQNRLQADVQELLGADSDWSSVAPTIRDCKASSGWQRILTWTNDTPRPTYTQDDVTNVTAAAEKAGLAPVTTSLAQDQLARLVYQDAESEAELTVTTENGSLTVTTASACAIDK